MVFPNVSSEDDSTPVDPNRRYPNPNFGLEIWGPLVPANDCKSCLYTLTGIQMATGLYMWFGPGRTKARLGTVLRPATIWKNRLLRTTGVFTGTYLLFMSSLELLRLQLTRDPWAEDAAAARRKAEARDGAGSVSRWFGPKGYRAVEYQEWKRRVDEALPQLEENNDKIVNVGRRVPQYEWSVVKDVHTEIRESNRALAKKILEDGLDDSIPSGGLDQAAQLHPMFREPEDSEPATQEKTKNGEEKEEEKENDEDVPVWYAMNPWQTLRDDIDVQVRIIPHTRGVGITSFEDETDPENELVISIEEDSKK